LEQLGLEGIEQSGDVLEGLLGIETVLEGSCGLAEIDIDLEYEGLEMLDRRFHPLQLVTDTAQCRFLSSEC
jgi:hypothetical protein